MSTRDIFIADFVSYISGGRLGYAVNKILQTFNDEYRTIKNEERLIEGNPKDQAGWRPLPKEESKFHQPDNGDTVTKYVTDDGKGEIVWNDTKNEQVTDPKIKGTYNYAGKNKIFHGVVDILPWIVYGTGKDDTSNLEDRIKQTIEGAQELFDKKGEQIAHDIYQNMTPQGIIVEAGKQGEKNESK